MRSGGSYLSQSDLRAAFRPRRVRRARGRGGPHAGRRRWRWRGLPVDRLHVLELSPAARTRAAGAARCRLRARAQSRLRCAGTCSRRQQRASRRRSRAPVFRPQLTTPEALEPFLKHLEPGSDAFAAEREREASRHDCASSAQAARRRPRAGGAAWPARRRTSAAARAGPSRAGGPAPRAAWRSRAAARRATRRARRPRLRRTAARLVDALGTSRSPSSSYVDRPDASRAWSDAARACHDRHPHRRALRHRRAGGHGAARRTWARGG